MDPSTLSPASLAGPLAVVTAAGTAVTVLTEVAKQYIPTEKVAPPIISATIAALFVFCWEVSQPTTVSWADTFGIVMTWFALFQVSIAVYHGSQLATKHRAQRLARQTETIVAVDPDQPTFPPIPNLPINDPGS